MSAIAGIVHFDGRPVDPVQVEKMTAAMAHRGPDGIAHWTGSTTALGYCNFITTPQARAKSQPLQNSQTQDVLVMDGRVDNAEELRRELMSKGLSLRTGTDAELVLRAYEAWGEDCPQRIVGELAFVIWDERRKKLFAARDVAGTRQFFYHRSGPSFFFASEIRGLLALHEVPRRLKESKVLDFLVVQYDRDDVEGTFYKDIFRIAPGHSMTIDAGSISTRRYWHPEHLQPSRFASPGECAEAFLAQLREVVKCRLPSVHSVGALMSGGLDSSSIVGVVRNNLRDELDTPLKTFSLVREDRENCREWPAVQAMIAGGWIDPTVITAEDATPAAAAEFMAGIAEHDDPFELVSLFPTLLTFRAAKRAGCRVLLEGMGGDLLFYSPGTSQRVIAGRRMLGLIAPLITAQRRHQSGLDVWRLPWQLLAESMPDTVRVIYRSLRHRDPSLAHMREEIAGDNFRRMRPDVRANFLESKKQSSCNPRYPRPLGSDQAFHAFHFEAAMLSAGHEWEGELAASMGLEQRSPYSDRRMIEFGIRMPVEAKVAAPWYKPMLRRAMVGILPPSVVWRDDLGNHPGFQSQRRLLAEIQRSNPDLLRPAAIQKSLGAWIDTQKLQHIADSALRPGSHVLGYNLMSLALLAKWIDTRF